MDVIVTEVQYFENFLSLKSYKETKRYIPSRYFLESALPCQQHSTGPDSGHKTQEVSSVFYLLVIGRVSQLHSHPWQAMHKIRTDWIAGLMSTRVHLVPSENSYTTARHVCDVLVFAFWGLHSCRRRTEEALPDKAWGVYTTISYHRYVSDLLAAATKAEVYPQVRSRPRTARVTRKRRGDWPIASERCWHKTLSLRTDAEAGYTPAQRLAQPTRVCSKFSGSRLATSEDSVDKGDDRFPCRWRKAGKRALFTRVL